MNPIKATCKVFESLWVEMSYHHQILKLYSELEKTREELAERNQENYNLILEVGDLTGKLEDARSEISDSKAGYSSLLRDYYEMMDRHCDFKRRTSARIEELENQHLEVSI